VAAVKLNEDLQVITKLRHDLAAIPIS